MPQSKIQNAPFLCIYSGPSPRYTAMVGTDTMDRWADSSHAAFTIESSNPPGIRTWSSRELCGAEASNISGSC